MTHTELDNCPLGPKILLFGLNLDVFFLCIHNNLIDNFLNKLVTLCTKLKKNHSSLRGVSAMSFFFYIRNLSISNFLNKLAKNLNETEVFIFFCNLMYKM